MKTQKLVLILLAVITLVCFAACNNPWWPQRGDVTVDFDPNGGSGTPPAQSVTDGESITVPTSNGLTRNGFYFDGWNTKADYSGKDYYVGQSYKTAGSATLFARWITADSPYYYYPYYPTSTSDGANTVTPRGKGGNNSTPPKVTYHSEIPGAGISPNIMVRAAAPKVLGVFTVPDGTHTVKEGRDFALDDPQYKPKYEFAQWVNHTDYIKAGDWLESGTELTITKDTDLYALWLETDKVIRKSPIAKQIPFGEKVYGDYTASDLEETITIWNTIPESNKATGKLTVVYEYRKDDNPILNNENPFEIVFDGYAPNVSSINNIPLGGMLEFTIAPKDGLPIGNYSVIVRIYQEGALTYDDSDFYICFVAGFTVTPYPITIAITNIVYNDTGDENSVAWAIDALTPIEAGAYTERTAEITVVLSGFKETSGADGVALAFSVAGGLEFEKYADADGVTETGIGGAITKTFTVKVIYDGKTEFPSGTATIGVGMAGLNGNYSVSNVTGEAVRVRDGKAETDGPNGRVIRVTKANNETPYGAITPFNAYATNAADSTWPRALALNYRQTEHIVLADKDEKYVDVENNWAAIGTVTSTASGKVSNGIPFTGSYDGGGYTISNLKIDKAAANCQGMFSYIGAGGTVKKLGLANVSVTGSDYVGGVAAFNAGTVENCYAKGAGIEAVSSIAGGLVGMNDDSGIIRSCYALNISVTSAGQSGGGIAGYNRNLVENCYSSGGTITAGSYGGGIVGKFTSESSNGQGQMLVQYCYSACSVEINLATDYSAGGVSSIGGVAMIGKKTATLRNSAAFGLSVTTITYSNLIDRVAGGGNNKILANNYARAGMKVIKGATETVPSGANPDNNTTGKDIGSAEWGSEAWWKNTAAAAGGGPGFGSVWDFNCLGSGYLPRLLNMPGGPGGENALDIQTPAVPD